MVRPRRAVRLPQQPSAELRSGGRHNTCRLSIRTMAVGGLYGTCRDCLTENWRRSSASTHGCRKSVYLEMSIPDITFTSFLPARTF